METDQSAYWPDYANGTHRNVAILSRYALEAYPGGDPNFTLSDTRGIEFKRIKNANFECLVAIRDGGDKHLECIIAIAGTNKPEDILVDLDLTPTKLGDFCQQHGIKDYCGRVSARIHGGFLDHAWLGLHTIHHQIGELSKKYNRDADRIWLVGHSLGGAVACVIPELVNADVNRRLRVFAFGAPRIYARRRTVRHDITMINHIFDPVCCVPLTYWHPNTNEIWIRRRNSFRDRRPWKAFGTLAGYAMLSASAWLLRRFGLKVNPLKRMLQYHAMSNYYASLRSMTGEEND